MTNLRAHRGTSAQALSCNSPPCLSAGPRRRIFAEAHLPTFHFVVPPSATRHAAGLIHAIDGPTLSESKGTYQVVLAPLGNRRRPTNEGELRRAIQDVLHGVAALHQAGYVHRDIRWWVR